METGGTDDADQRHGEKDRRSRSADRVRQGGARQQQRQRLGHGQARAEVPRLAPRAAHPRTRQEELSSPRSRALPGNALRSRLCLDDRQPSQRQAITAGSACRVPARRASRAEPGNEVTPPSNASSDPNSHEFGYIFTVGAFAGCPALLMHTTQRRVRDDALSMNRWNSTSSEVSQSSDWAFCSSSFSKSLSRASL